MLHQKPIWEQIMIFSNEEFDRERTYQGMMYFVRGMLFSGLISEQEFEKISEDYYKKLAPKTGTLLSMNNLLCVKNRGNIDIGGV